ncbi:MAG: RHS repeat-associated core domain-containing protein, partial [Anaerovoracaceae bacterium]
NQLTETVILDNSSAELGSGTEEPAAREEETAETEAAEKLIPQRSYNYDKNGNEISVKEYSPPAGRTGKNLNDEAGAAEVIAERINTYDPANRLSSLTDTKAGKTILLQDNEYNGTGQRIKKTERQSSFGTPVPTAGIANSKEEAKNYYYQAGQVLYTENQAGSNAAKISSFNLLGISDNIIATERRTTNPKVPLSALPSRQTGDRQDRVYYFYNKDLRASTTSIVAESGAAVKAYKYDEFGNTESFGNLNNEIAYTGGIYDKSTQLYYLNARYYNPEDGRFITQDSYRGSKEDPGTWHLYAYCGNNPVNYVDPSGHKWYSKTFLKSHGKYGTARYSYYYATISINIRNGQIKGVPYVEKWYKNAWWQNPVHSQSWPLYYKQKVNNQRQKFYARLAWGVVCGAQGGGISFYKVIDISIYANGYYQCFIATVPANAYPIKWGNQT